MVRPVAVRARHQRNIINDVGNYVLIYGKWWASNGHSRLRVVLPPPATRLHGASLLVVIDLVRRKNAPKLLKTPIGHRFPAISNGHRSGLPPQCNFTRKSGSGAVSRWSRLSSRELGPVPLANHHQIELNTVAYHLYGFRSGISSAARKPPQSSRPSPSGAKRRTRPAAAGNTAILSRRGLQTIAGLIRLVFQIGSSVSTHPTSREFEQPACCSPQARFNFSTGFQNAANRASRRRRHEARRCLAT